MKLNYLFIGICTFLVGIYSFSINKTNKPDLKVYVLDGGYMKINDLSYFSHDSAYVEQTKVLENPVFLIEHEKGRMIWEAGLPDELADRKPAEIDTSSWIVSYVRKKLIDQLSNMELSPDSIDYFVVSHTHTDHAGNANYFKNSTWIVDKREYEWAYREGEESIQHYDSLRTAKHIFFNGNYDVFKDSTVIIHSMPGHTPGHMCLSIKLEDQNLLLSGDLYHFIEQREHKRVPVVNTDVEQTLQSMERFEELAEELRARVIIQHERKHYKQLPKYPAYLE